MVMLVIVVMMMLVVMVIVVMMMLVVVVIVVVMMLMVVVIVVVISLFLSVYKNMYMCAMNAALFRLLLPHFHARNSDFIKSFHKSFRIIMQL
jgi:hypothetical protein